ncbi:MAG TPA: ABC transporter substrate-binding protein [Candidatus Pullichristensenella excrementigallinarum]|uniref:ABC transporter substrate-binding protein n=1 Tax=Candidatus Pullichristensenella excrementigallinarum TaxID=2840907 RepID=A0A9D1IA16_9FIRM|nr:ABC transporter substrate-binding protein [Candidatus Pullichristensenella excrementigallinarum]
MKRVLTLILTLSMLLSIGAFAEESDDFVVHTPPSGLSVTAVEDTLTVGSRGEPTTLDPQMQNDQPSTFAVFQLYETLLYKDSETGEFKPMLAESWEQIDDRTVRFHIRQGVTDHAGNPFTANDVYFTIQRGIESALKSYCWGVFDGEATTVIDDYTIDICTKEPFGPMLDYLTNNAALMVTQKAVEDLGEDAYGRNPVGATGPYKFVEWVAGDRIVLTRNENYWGEQPYFSNLVIRNITDDTTRALSLESGDIDVCIDVPGAQLGALREVPIVDLFTIPSYTLNYLGINCVDGPLADVRVRQALRYALDLEPMVEIAFSGTATMADGPYTTSLSCYTPPSEEETYSYNPEKAKELLAEAGYPDGFEVNLWANENQSRIDMCEMLQNAWGAIGVKANVQIMEFGSYLEKLANGEHDIYMLGFVSAGDDGDYLHDMFYSTYDYTRNKQAYKNPEYDEAIDMARVSSDPAVRQECYDKVQSIIRHDLPWIPLACGTYTYGIRSTLTGMELQPAGNPHLCWITPKEA